MYEYTDKVIKKLNKNYLRLFSKLNFIKFDELNVISTVSKVYKQAYELAKQNYIDLALWYYKEISGKELSHKKAVDIVEEMLEEYNDITFYVFNHEVDRKKARMYEAILASQNSKSKEIRKNFYYWILQSKQYADFITDRAVLEAYKEIGVKKVRWKTAEDEKVCNYCQKRDNKVYPIDKLPKKAHYNCRCWLEVVK